MKQILQNIRNGTTELRDLPYPLCHSGHAMISSRTSLISAGTERMMLDFGKAGWIEKAQQQPDKVRQALDKIRSDGLVPTLEAVFKRLDEPILLWYCNMGVVLKVGEGIMDLQPGDQVASNGPYEEVVYVPKSLYARYA